MSIATPYERRSTTDSLLETDLFAPDMMGEIELDEEVWREAILDALAPSAWQTGRVTSSHRIRGEDTLTGGALDTWILVSMVRCLVELPAARIGECAMRLLGAEPALAIARLSKLGELFRFADPLKIERFLRNHPRIIDVLFEAYPRVVQEFGNGVQIELDVVVQPEEGFQEQMFVYIHTSLDVDQALTRLDRLDHDWFIAQIDTVGDLFNFNIGNTCLTTGENF